MAPGRESKLCPQSTATKHGLIGDEGKKISRRQSNEKMLKALAEKNLVIPPAQSKVDANTKE